MQLRTILLMIIGFVGYIAWAVLAFFDPSQRASFLNFNMSMVIGTVGLVLRDMPPPSQDTPKSSGDTGSTPAPMNSQSGHARPWFLLLIAASAALLLPGCSSLQYAGTADYTVKPFVIDAKTGTVACCQVEVHNGKEVANVEAHISKQGDNITVDLKEQGVQAFQGQAIAAGATKDAIDAAAKAAVAAALGPVLPALVPAAGQVLSSPGLGSAVGGAALGVAADKALTPAPTK